MKKILFPTDFSSNALHASQYAGLLAKQLNANVILLHSYSIPPMLDVQFQYNMEGYLLKIKEDAQKQLASFAQVFSNNTGLPTHRISLLLVSGATSETIIESANEMEADFIVMGTKGAGNILDKWFGTNSQNVMKSATCPVWIVPQNTLMKLPETIMYAADFKEDEFTATQKILDLSNPLGAKCKVVHVHEYYELNVMGEIEKEVNHLQDRFANEDVTFEKIEASKVIGGLEKYIKIHKPDVLAMAMHEKSFLSKIFDPSISNHFVQEANLPILIFKK